jgi:hypothetical protein
MFDSATSTLEYRPTFGRRAPHTPSARDGFYAPGWGRGVDSITAELRRRILITKTGARPAVAPPQAR